MTTVTILSFETNTEPLQAKERTLTLNSANGSEKYTQNTKCKNL